MREIINMTPHAVTLYKEDGTTVTFTPSGTVPRVKQINMPSVLDDVPCNVATFGQVEQLPEFSGDSLKIVSTLVRNACPTRYDLISPDTSPASVVRDENGNILGVKGFLSNV